MPQLSESNFHLIPMIQYIRHMRTFYMQLSSDELIKWFFFTELVRREREEPSQVPELPLRALPEGRDEAGPRADAGGEGGQVRRQSGFSEFYTNSIPLLVCLTDSGSSFKRGP